MKLAKVAALLFVITMSAKPAFAENVLEQLPFGIKIGATKNKEIENRGLCVKKVAISDTYYRCEEYEMMNGKFSVKSSQNEIVTNILFSAGAHGQATTNAFPQKWSDLGLRLCPVEPDGIRRVPGSGTSLEAFLKIVKAAGAKDITTSQADDRRSHGQGLVLTTVSFTVGATNFVATFATKHGIDTDKSPSERYSFERGLIKLELSEAY